MIALFADPAVFALAAGVFGLMVGSFLNVVIHRLPIMMQRDWAAQCAELNNTPIPPAEPLSLARPRSRCPKCGHMISALENLPILSWIILWRPVETLIYDWIPVRRQHTLLTRLLDAPIELRVGDGPATPRPAHATHTDNGQ